MSYDPLMAGTASPSLARSLFLGRIDDDLAVPFPRLADDERKKVDGLRFLVHGAEVDVKEEPWPGTVAIIEFPDVDAAQAWYHSPAYQAILPLRTNNIDGSALIVKGVGPDYDPARTAAALRERVG